MQLYSEEVFSEDAVVLPIPVRKAQQSEDNKTGRRRSLCIGSCAFIFASLTMLVLVLFLASLNPAVWRLVQGVPVYGLGSNSMLGKHKYQCLYKLWKLNAESSGFRDIEIAYSDDAEVHVAQTGRYVGAEDIEEYFSYVRGATSPYFSVAGPDDRRATSIYVLGYEEGLCSFQITFVDHFEMDPSFATVPGFLAGFTTTTKIDYTSGQVVDVEAYLPPFAFELIHDALGRSNATYDFICDSVLKQSCNATAEETMHCKERLLSLPLTEGPYYGIDGDSLGCRALHAAFAVTNPTGHCAHVALDATEDDQGRIKCQVAKNIDPRSKMSDQHWVFFKEQMENFGIDPDIGTMPFVE